MISDSARNAGRRRSRFAGLGLSVGVHALIALTFLGTMQGERRGGAVASGEGEGNGPHVAVSLLRHGSSKADKAKGNSDQSEVASSAESGSESSAEFPGSEPAQLPSVTPDSQLAPSESASAIAQGRGPEAAGAKGSSGGQGSQPGVLAEIARCLPPNIRPKLVSAQLTLVADPDGNLTAAPTIAFTTSGVGAEDTRQADLIVQAALQCGPYHDPSLRGQAVALVADFQSGQMSLEGTGTSSAQTAAPNAGS